MNDVVDINISHPTVHDAVASYLEEEGITENHHIRNIAKAALHHLEKRDPSVKNWKHIPLDSEEESLLQSAIEDVLISAKTPWNPQLPSEDLSPIQRLVLAFMRGQNPSIKELLKKEYLLSVIWKKNSEILGEARELLNQIFADMVEDLKQKELSPIEAFHMEMIIGDLLSLYPFLSPEQDEILSLPLQVDGEWQLVEYTVDRIPLTPDWLGSPLMAFGLIPSTSDSAPPLLIFKGTTYPTDEGFGLSLMIDINPFAPVGHYGFRWGKERISDWLKAHTTTSKARIYGKSLGGALAWQAALSFPKRVEQVMAYGAPGFSSKDLKRCQHLEQKDKLPPIHMFCQENDPIPAVDHVAISGIQYYQVLGKHSRTGIAAHADMYSTHEISTIIRLDPNQEARRWMRFGLTLLRMIASVSIFPLLIPLYGIKVVAAHTGEILHNQIRNMRAALRG